MKNIKALGALAVGLTLFSTGPTAQAQNALPVRTALLPTTGIREIGVAGNYSFNGNKPYALQGSYGDFLSPVWEWGGIASVAGAGGSHTASSVGAFADYYFPSAATDNPLVPYVGAFLGYSHVIDDSASLGAQGGVKYFFNPNVALTAEFQYRAARHSNGQSNLILGLSTFFR